MSEVGYALALGLAAVFASAGIAKLRAPRRTARSFRALAIPPVLARVVPAAEIALAVLLVVDPTSAIVALLALAAFTIVLARADEGVTCACFGSASTEPVSWVHLLRNAVLMAVAAAASFGERGAPGMAAGLTAIGIAALCLLVLTLAGLKRQVGALIAVELP